MGKTRKEGATKRPYSSNNKDSFFSKSKSTNTLSQNSSNHLPKYNMKRKLFRETSQHSHEPSTQGSSNDFFLKKSDSQQSLASKELGTNSAKESQKKPFDKKKWRLQKYSKKYKLEQWEEKRRKSMAREYYKQLKHDDSAKFDIKKLYETEDNSENESAAQEVNEENQAEAGDAKKTKRPRIFQTAQSRYQQIQQEKEEKKAEALKRKAEKQAALETYKKKKLEKYKKLNQKTKKGQPIMRHRMEMLLEQIQKTCT